MQNDFRNLIAIFLLFTPLIALGQQSSSRTGSDTLMIYETETVFDTLYVHDTLKATENVRAISVQPENSSFNIMESDASRRQSGFLIIPGEKTATIRNNGIILSENNKNSDSMKKTGLLGIALFAMHGVVTAQTDLGISAGAGLWRAKCSESIVNSVSTPLFKSGFFAAHTFKSHIFLRTEINYTYLTSNYSYKAVVDQLNWVIAGEEESTTAYHLISIPLQAGFKLGRLKPYLGLEYACRIPDARPEKRINVFSLSGGINFSLSGDISLGLNYYKGLTKDYTCKGTISDPLTGKTVGQYNDYWKSNRIELSIFLILHKERKTGVIQTSL